MDLSKLGRGELIAAVSGVLLFIFLFFNWYGAPSVDAGFDIEGFAESVGVDTSFSAWQSFDVIDLILALTAIVAVGLAGMAAAARSVSLPVAASALTAGLGILAVVLVLYRLINPPGEGLERELGIWLGLLASIGVAAGGWMAMQEEGTSFSEQADRIGASRGEGGPPSGEGGPPSGEGGPPSGEGGPPRT